MKGGRGLRLVFLGPPGAGKGTQAKDLANAAGVPHLSTGDMLRKAAAEGTPVGRRVKPVLDSGGLVSDDVMWSVVSDRLEEPDCAEGFVLDGFPRTVPQATTLAEKLVAQRTPLAHVIFFDVPEAELVKRLSRRGRADDKPAVIRERLRNYAVSTAPLKEWYTAKGLLRPVDGVGTPDEVGARLLNVTGLVAR